MPFQTKPAVLLTGAGFTKDVGGFLAQEMWAQVFNSSHVQTHNRLVGLLKENFDYESVYDKVMHGQYKPDEKDALTEALRAAYRRLDDRNQRKRYVGSLYGTGWMVIFNAR